jgi:hypothetical protein
VYSQPDEHEVVEDIWPESWVLPFRIHPLGSPAKQLDKDEAMASIDVLKHSGTTNIGHALPLAPTSVFSPKPISSTDWAQLLAALAD